MATRHLNDAKKSARRERDTGIRGRRPTALALVIFGLVFVVACIGADSAGDPPGGTAPTAPSQIAPDLSTWLTYTNPQYALALQYPPTHKVVELENQLQPAPIFRAGFLPTSLIRPTGLEPPLFAIDVYANASQVSLDAWLASSGATTSLRRPVQDTVQVGAVPGIRLVDQTLLAPNTFYYVARGSLVYRFTPLGTHSDEILKTVRFTS